MTRDTMMMTLAGILVGGIALASTPAALHAPTTAKPAAGKHGTKEGPESEADEKTVALKNLPAAVRTTVEAETKNATIRGISKEREHGKTVYEVESLVNGRTRDFMVDATGKVYSVEEQLDLDKAPTPVRTALESRGTVLTLESVVENGKTTYEGQVKTKDGKKVTVVLDATGKAVKP